MEKFDLKTVIDKMKNEKKIFVSERDFQFALAWQIKNMYDSAEVKLEFNPNISIQKIKKSIDKNNNVSEKSINCGIHIDILVIYDNKWYPIEIKYKTKKIFIEGLNTELKNQGAQDQGKCNFIWDIKRIEYFKEKFAIIDEEMTFGKGYAVFITNDDNYYGEQNNNSCELTNLPYDYSFRLDNNRIIDKKEKLRWNDKAALGTIGSCPLEIILDNTYTIIWDDFCEFENNNGKFKYLIVEI